MLELEGFVGRAKESRCQIPPLPPARWSDNPRLTSVRPGCQIGAAVRQLYNLAARLVLQHRAARQLYNRCPTAVQAARQLYSRGLTAVQAAGSWSAVEVQVI